MPRFGKKSKSKLNTCHPDIHKVMDEAIKHYDFSVTYGFRSLEVQKMLYDSRPPLTKTLRGKHNEMPSLAIDIAPYPIDFKNLKRFYFMAGIVLATAKSFGIDLRWGGDWDGDMDLDDQTFMDLGHFEIKTKGGSAK